MILLLLCFFFHWCGNAAAFYILLVCWNNKKNVYESCESLADILVEGNRNEQMTVAKCGRKEQNVKSMDKEYATAVGTYIKKNT